MGACATNVKNKQVLNSGGNKTRPTNLRDVRVPINVANVIIGQASEEIDQMLQRCRTTCYTGKTETRTDVHSANKSIYSPLPSLEDFVQTSIS